jgi:hypothetical protein
LAKIESVAKYLSFNISILDERELVEGRSRTANISMQINEMARYRAENPQLPLGFADGM